MAASPTTTYSTVSTGLRPARVVVVFDGGEHWTFWARRALYTCGFAWGGAGFALVPHRDGVVDPVLLRLCVAYDPDHVVAMSPTIGELEQLSPSWLQQGAAGSKVSTPAERERVLREEKDRIVAPLHADDQAQRQVAEACSVYRLPEDNGWRHEVKTTLELPRPGEIPEVMSIPGAPGGVMLACPPSWGGLLGVAVAARAGCVESPDPAAEPPKLDDGELGALTEWQFGAPGRELPRQLLWSPTVVAGVLTEQVPVVADRTLLGLVSVSNPSLQRGPHLIVLGDEPEDFALARLWQLVHGVGHWVPSALGTSREDLPSVLGERLQQARYDAYVDGGQLVLTSISRTSEQLDADRAFFLSSFPYLAQPQPAGSAELHVTAAQQLSWKGLAWNHWAVRNQFDDRYTVPTTVDINGTKTMEVPLPPPVFRDPALAASDVDYHVDVTWESEQCVLGRGLEGTAVLEGRAVFASDNPRWRTQPRRGRAGTSYQAAPFDPALSGIQTENRLARPRLRDLSLRDWVGAKATEHGLRVRTSRAGHRSAQLARMLGSRASFVELFSGPLLPALRAMRPTESSTTAAYPQKDGVRLSAEVGCLTFAGVCNHAPKLPEPEVRRRVDAALRANVLRRGLVMECYTCEEVQFQPIDKLGQRWTCLRCDALNDLDQRAWRLPPTEPQWYYDLHPVGRHLLRDHGEVPALLSAYLSDRSEQFHDVDELELTQDGNPVVELDLIAYMDDTLIVAECKSTNALPGSNSAMKREIEKKCRASAWLRADELIFATTASAWTDRVQRTISNIVQQYPWGPLGAPTIRLVTNLGPTSAADHAI